MKCQMITKRRDESVDARLMGCDESVNRSKFDQIAKQQTEMTLESEILMLE